MSERYRKSFDNSQYWYIIIVIKSLKLGIKRNVLNLVMNTYKNLPQTFFVLVKYQKASFLRAGSPFLIKDKIVRGKGGVRMK